MHAAPPRQVFQDCSSAHSSQRGSPQRRQRPSIRLRPLQAVQTALPGPRYSHLSLRGWGKEGAGDGGCTVGRGRQRGALASAAVPSVPQPHKPQPLLPCRPGAGAPVAAAGEAGAGGGLDVGGVAGRAHPGRRAVGAAVAAAHTLAAHRDVGVRAARQGRQEQSVGGRWKGCVVARQSGALRRRCGRYQGSTCAGPSPLGALARRRGLQAVVGQLQGGGEARGHA